MCPLTVGFFPYSSPALLKVSSLCFKPNCSMCLSSLWRFPSLWSLMCGSYPLFWGCPSTVMVLLPFVGSWSWDRASLVAQLVKNLPVVSVGDLSLIPGSGRSPGEGNGNPFQHSCVENPMDRGAWQARVHGIIRVRRGEHMLSWWEKPAGAQKNSLKQGSPGYTVGVSQSQGHAS